MSEADQGQVDRMLTTVAVAGRVRISGKRSALVVHRPIAVSDNGCDFVITGQRRRRNGEKRTWDTYRLAVAKLLIVEKYRLVVQDVYGNILTVSHPGQYEEESPA